MMLIRNSRLQMNDLINYINARSLNIFFSFHLKTTTFIIIFFIIHFFHFFHLFYSFYSSYSSFFI
jgi:hypothetical protein